jgi:hypothetical protein
VDSGEVTGGAPGDTSPGTPASAGHTPGEGAQDGIETQESDSEGPGFANGGMVGDPNARANTGMTINGFTDETNQELVRSGGMSRGQYATTLGMSIKGVAAFANGGLIQGPGTGTSDSIPATTETGAPLAVSNGEFTIPPAVVQALGKDFFDELIAQYHTPTPGQAPIYQADAPMDSPLGVQTGSIIIPADVVQAVGLDTFEAMVAQYGGAQ